VPLQPASIQLGALGRTVSACLCLSTDLDPIIASAAEPVRIACDLYRRADRCFALSIQSLNAAVRDVGQDSGGGSIFKLSSASTIPAIARLSGIAWVEPWVEPTLHNAIARSNLAMNKNGVEPGWACMARGRLSWSAIQASAQATRPPFTPISVAASTGTTGPASTCHNWTDAVDHGTHVAGSVLGSGYRSGAVTTTHSYSGTNAGIAPEALLYAWGFCSDFSGLPDTNPYTDYYNVMYGADSRARTNTNSWGYTNLHGLYITFSKETDRFLWIIGT
jgi:hypothetical protein